MRSNKTKNHSSIAVIGMACHYPGASDLKTLWENIVSSKRQFRRFPDQRLSLDRYSDSDRKQLDKTYATQAGLIEGFDFDWIGHRIPKKTLESTDIVHWLTYQVALRAVEDAGYQKGEFPKETTGVILGNTLTGEQTRSSYMRQRWPFIERTLRASAGDFKLSEEATNAFIERTEEYYKSVFPVMTEDSLAGGLSNTIAGRVCNVLNVNGGGYTVDGACASSLIAVATAAEKLASGTLDVVIAGGVDVSLDTFEMVGFARTGALTPDEMRVYDKRGNGFMPGEGCGLLILKRLDDAQRDGDKVYAVLQGWGISSDGKGGITAPNGIYQGLSLKRAYSLAPYGPEDLDFVEGHGTGTTVGDREELKGIAQTVGNETDGKLRRCGLTSFKSIVGHTKAAAGAGGLIKAVLAVNQRVIPPTSNCEQPNEFFNSPEGQAIYPILLGQTFPEKTVLRAGVSAMGFGGINTHVTLESGHAPYPHIKSELPLNALLASTQKTEIYPLAANSATELLAAARQLQTLAFGMSISELPDLAAMWSQRTENCGPYRASLIANHPQQLNTHLQTLIDYIEQQSLVEGEELELVKKHVWISIRVNKSRLGFVFPGQGSQQLNMAFQLVRRYSWAQDLVQQADTILQESSLHLKDSLRNLIFRPSDRALNKDQLTQWNLALTQTNVAQPAICLASALWLERLKRLGLRPAVVGGHSLGELSAFYAAGAFDFTSLLQLAGRRGYTMHHTQSTGSMSAFMCNAEQARSVLDAAPGYTVIANINHPTQTVISGEKDAVETANELARNLGITVIPLPVSNAFHSRLVASASDSLKQNCPVTGSLQSETPIISAVTGKALPKGEALQHYFSNQITAPVDFIALTQELNNACDMIIEVGPGTALSNMISKTLEQEPALALPVEAKSLSDQDLNVILANFHCRGGDINWHELYDSRLIRPFVAAAEKLFINNACEADFSVADIDPSLTQVFQQPLHESTANHNQDNAALGISMNKFVNLSNEKTSPLSSTGTMQQAAHTTDDVQSPSAVNAIEERLLALVSESTGFPPDSLSNDLRLLDDLNLDSIKAAELIGEVATSLSIQEAIDPAPMANASISEISQLLNALKTQDSVDESPSAAQGTSSVDHVQLINSTYTPPSVEQASTLILETPLSPANTAAAELSLISPPQCDNETLQGKDTIQTVLVTLIEEATGFPAESLTSDLRLLDDLNLDSIKAAELIGSTAMQLSLPSDLDPAPLANASIEEIATKLAQLSAKQQVPQTYEVASLKDSATPTAPKPALEVLSKKTSEKMPIQAKSVAPQVGAAEQPWVRNFVMKPVEQTLAAEQQQALEQNKETLVISEQEELPIAQRLAQLLHEKGVKTKAGKFSTISNNPAYLHQENLRYIVLILPRSASVTTTADSVRKMVNRLHCITPLKSDTKSLSISFVQFAGGAFGVNETPMSIEQAGALALASSLHLEKKQLDVRITDFHAKLDPMLIAQKVIAEMMLPGDFVAAGYNESLKRTVLQPQIHQPSLDQSRNIDWTPNDVLIVTGGAKGITAECAMAFAKLTGVKMALVGSSPAPQEGSEHEINQTLQRFEQLGLQANYYACDLSDASVVAQLVDQIQHELGAVTGVIHGAAVNKPRPLSYASADEAYQEISPKVLGALHLCQLFESQPLKLFASLTSIIGITGMVGNGWYGFSNEVLDLLVGQYAARHPETQAIATAYSVWGDVGMGARMGSTDYLAKMGICSIPTDEGVNRFVQLLLNDSKARQVVICARLAGLDTWVPPRIELPPSSRYLENIVYAYPGIEVISQAHLTLEKDNYVQDHVWKGSYLFPTVFGLEAMAQAVSAVTGMQRFTHLRIEDIKLQRPIVVNKNTGVNIQIQACLQEAKTTKDLPRIRVSISTEQSHFRVPHFSAVFILGGAEGKLNELPSGLPEFPEQALTIDPKRDMYSWLLFQGPQFQRLNSFHRVDNDYCLFTTSAQNNEEQHWMLGSPFVRDSLLQSVQPMVPQHICLPICIDAINIFDTGASLPSTLKGIATNDAFADEEYSTSVFAQTQQGQLLESMENYRLRILEYRSDFPADKPFSNPVAHEEQAIQQALQLAQKELKIDLPALQLSYIPNLSHMDKKQRHSELKSLIEPWLASTTGQTSEVDWASDGKPLIKGTLSQMQSLSISHHHSHVLVVTGQGEHGCDIEMISERSPANWQTILGKDIESPSSLAAALQQGGDTLNVAATRLWSVKEAAFKASGEFEQQVSISKHDNAAVLFHVKTCNAEIDIVTFPVTLQRGGRKMVATTTQVPLQTLSTAAKQPANNNQGLLDLLQRNMQVSYNNAPTKNALNGTKLLPREEFEHIGYQPDHYLIGMNPPQHSGDIPVFVMRTPLYFKDAQMLSRGVFFANYFLWMGKTREAATYPIMSPMAEQLVTGKWGLVTNSASVQIYGEASSGDIVETHFWMGRVFDSNDSTFDLFYDWRKLMPDGSQLRIAKGLMRASWVKILDHGIVAPEPLPDYFSKFVDQMQPEESGNTPDYERLYEPLKEQTWGEVLAQSPAGPRCGWPLSEMSIPTSLDDANSVGNVYFSNYSRWQGITRDQFFFDQAPEYFRGIGEKGELVATSAQIEHLREAMPFDTILVVMRVSTIAECGAELHFDYFRSNPDGTRTKLAVGSQKMLWAKKNAVGLFEAAPWPEVYKNALLNAAPAVEPPARSHSDKTHNIEPVLMMID